MLKLTDVSKRFGDNDILKSLSFEVAPGSTLALLGLSGSGKTTALKLCCGLISPDQGDVRVKSESLVGVDKKTLRKIRRNIGYVIQSGGLFPHLTVRENLLLIAREEEYSNDNIKSRLGELCEMTKISSELLEKFPREISGGERQRVGIMRAFFRDPEIFLLDEPFGALDPITRRGLQMDLKELFVKTQKTVILVTHDLYEAAYMADQILLLNNGSVAQQGTFKDLMRHPANDFVRLFVSSQSHTQLEEER